MQVRVKARKTHFVAVLAAVAMTASPLRAQSGAKVLTPPRPADTARTPARPSTNATAPGGSSPTAAKPAPVIPQSAVLDSIREAVFHNLLDKDRSGFATLASAFCLALSADDFKKASTLADRADASESMVRRLATSRSPARRASTCTFAPNAAAGRPVAGRPLLYSVGAIDLSSGDRAEAAAGYNYGGYSAGGFTFTVERTDSGWVVKQWRSEWTARSNAP
jgi:hypothetical protein